MEPLSQNQRQTRHSANAANTWNRHMRGTESLWYYGTERKERYIRFEAKKYFDANLPPNTGDVFVSVKSVFKLGSSLLGSPNTASSNGNDTGNNALQQDQPEKWDDEELLENFPTDWKMPETSIAQPPKVWVRLPNNNETELQTNVKRHRKTSDTWTAHVRKVLSLGSGKSFKPTRQCDMPLKKPLLIEPLTKREQLINSRFDMTVEEFFLGLIEEANQSNDNSKQTANSSYGEWLLQLYDPSLPGYVKMSIADPFEFYATWIHEDDWHSYMTMLGETGTDPIRKFISFKDQSTFNTLDGLLLTVGERDLKIQGALTSQERKSVGLDSEQAGYDKAIANEFRRPKIAAAVRNRRLKGINSFAKTQHFKHGQTAVEVTLSEAKMAAASGKRATQPGQAAVMGGVSASAIASSLGWEEQRLSSGFSASEWLHLAAFSWGGFEPTGAKSGFSTSQNLENLIFGTSETNSLMTRYEMAWQDFYRKEQQLHDKKALARKEQPRSLQGRLEIHCNDFSQPIRYDHYTDGKYQFGDFTMKKQLVKKTSDLAELMFELQHPRTMSNLYKPDVDETTRHFQDSRAPGEFTTEAEMLFLAHDFPYVVYSMKYTVATNFISQLLNEPTSSTASFSFYPFQRSLYHQAEAVLDALVWKKIKQKAEVMVKSEIGEDAAEEVDAALGEEGTEEVDLSLGEGETDEAGLSPGEGETEDMELDPVPEEEQRELARTKTKRMNKAIQKRAKQKKLNRKSKNVRARSKPQAQTLNHETDEQETADTSVNPTFEGPGNGIEEIIPSPEEGGLEEIPEWRKKSIEKEAYLRKLDQNHQDGRNQIEKRDSKPNNAFNPDNDVGIWK
ncbi:hypothetical protein QBC35DRAFT_502815 [Podospora australis]|uniref:Uncharacterized protein n=1 Tax=Podospora australis TaxID=1536484 RepID=A0AAN6WQZ9_9PEZI|nr:hypothetical protein QBC35DRAFT_502815 [Podospora australis]